MYKQSKTPEGQIQNCVIRMVDNAIIPLVEDNIDYQAYLKWLEEGGQPLPADE